MNIRTKLTLIFFGIVIVVVSFISLGIYYFSAEYREQDFYRRLKNRAINVAKLLIEFEEVDAALLQRMERDNPASLPEQYVIVYDYKNEILYKTEGNQIIAADTVLLNRIRLQDEVRFKQNALQVLGFLYADKYDRFTIIAAATDINGLDALDNLRNVLFITLAISVILVSILGWIFSGKVLSPISRIVAEVDNITEVNLDQRLDEGNRKDELSKLAQTFNKMVARLQRAFFAQKNFIANASHEIKTPITIMTGEIEVTLLQPRTPEYYTKVLKSVLDGIKGMNKLSTQLLLLAQTSSDSPEKRFSQIRIDDVVWAVKEDLSKAFPDYIIDIQFDISITDEGLKITADEELLKVVILNLMDNGCKYSADNKVRITLKSDDDGVIVEFVNQGDNIRKQDADKIFEPFYRGKSERKVKGFGIGLPLTKRILDLHHGTISFNSVQNGLTAFTIKIPYGVKRI